MATLLVLIYYQLRNALFGDMQPFSCRVFLFQEGDKGSKEGSSRGLFKIYMKGVKEATEAFKLWAAAKAKKIEQEQERNDKKPAPYRYIKVLKI